MAQVEADVLSLAWRVSLAVENLALVNKDFLTALGGDKIVSFLGIKPLDLAPLFGQWASFYKIRVTPYRRSGAPTFSWCGADGYAVPQRQGYPSELIEKPIKVHTTV